MDSALAWLRGRRWPLVWSLHPATALWICELTPTLPYRTFWEFEVMSPWSVLRAPSLTSDEGHWVALCIAGNVKILGFWDGRSDKTHVYRQQGM